MENNHASFGARIADMKRAANMLHESARAIDEASEIIMREAQHMDAAHVRFAQRTQSRQRQTASR